MSTPTRIGKIEMTTILSSGTSEGVKKEWDTRGRGKKEPVNEEGWLEPNGKFHPNNGQSHNQTAEDLGYEDYVSAFRSGLVRVRVGQRTLAPYGKWMTFDTTRPLKDVDGLMRKTIAHTNHNDMVQANVGQGEAFQRLEWNGKDWDNRKPDSVDLYSAADADAKTGTKVAGYAEPKYGPFRCSNCFHNPAEGECNNSNVKKDPELKTLPNGNKEIEGAGCCTYFRNKKAGTGSLDAGGPGSGRHKTIYEQYIHHHDYGIFSQKLDPEADRVATHAELIDREMPSMSRKYDEVHRGWAQINHASKSVVLSPEEFDPNGNFRLDPSVIKIPKEAIAYYQKKFPKYSVSKDSALHAYGTSEGVKKEWDERGRGQHPYDALTDHNLQEPDLLKVPGKTQSAGVLVTVQHEGKPYVVVYEPTHNFGGYKNTFSKGTIDPGETPQQTAVRELHEETGLLAKVTGYLGDFERGTSTARYYLGELVGGNTQNKGWESHDVKLVPVDDKLPNLLRNTEGESTSDFQVMNALREHLGMEKLSDTISYLDQKTGGQQGSNQGGFYKGSDGVDRYVKFYKDPAQGRGEALANTIYRGLDIGAPKSTMFDHDGTQAFASKIIHGGKTMENTGVTKEIANRVLDGFAADVLVGNWDVVGLNNDNILVKGDKSDPDVYRLDNGAAFLHRAQGAPKPEGALNQISEYEGFFNPSINREFSNMAKVAGYTSADQLGKRLVSQVVDIVHLRDDHNGWANYVAKKAPYMPQPERDKIVSMLNSRTNLLVAKALRLQPVKEVHGYSETEARVPSGSPGGGQWTSGNNPSKDKASKKVIEHQTPKHGAIFSKIHKGIHYVLNVERLGSGSVKYILNSPSFNKEGVNFKVFSSPSAAGTSVAGHPVNGWKFWSMDKPSLQAPNLPSPSQAKSGPSINEIAKKAEQPELVKQVPAQPAQQDKSEQIAPQKAKDATTLGKEWDDYNNTLNELHVPTEATNGWVDYVALSNAGKTNHTNFTEWLAGKSKPDLASKNQATVTTFYKAAKDLDALPPLDVQLKVKTWVAAVNNSKELTSQDILEKEKQFKTAPSPSQEVKDQNTKKVGYIVDGMPQYGMYPNAADKQALQDWGQIQPAKVKIQEVAQQFKMMHPDWESNKPATATTTATPTTPVVQAPAAIKREELFKTVDDVAKEVGGYEKLRMSAYNGDKDNTGNLMKVYKKLGLSDSDYYAHSSNISNWSGSSFDEFANLAQTAIYGKKYTTPAEKAMAIEYAVTQKILKDKLGEFAVLYRGVSGDYADQAWNDAKNKTVVTLKSRGADSWSSSQSFASNWASSGTGTLLQNTWPIERVITSHLSNLQMDASHPKEKEFVVVQPGKEMVLEDSKLTRQGKTPSDYGLMAEVDNRKVHHLVIDVTSDEALNWLHSMRTPEELKQDAEYQDWLNKKLKPVSKLMASTQKLRGLLNRLRGYGTSEGVKKEWDERGRGRKEKSHFQKFFPGKLLARKPKGFLDKVKFEGRQGVKIEMADGPMSKAERKDLDEKLGMPADQFAKALVSKFHPGELTDVTVSFEVNPFDKMDNEARDVHFQLQATTPGAGVVTMQRQLNLVKGTAYHEEFSLSNTKDQGKNVAKKLMESSLDLYDNLGITKISTFADLDVGGYAWARYGFVPDEDSWHKVQKDVMRPNGKELRPNIAEYLSPEARDIALKIIHSDNPKAIRALAALQDPNPPKGATKTAGQALLLGTDWDGSIDLTNKQDYSTIREYVGHAS